MRFSCFELMKTGALESLDVAEATKRWSAGDGAFWIDLDSYDAKELEKWLDGLDLRPFIKKRCLEIGKSTRLSLLSDCAYLEITVFSGDDNWNATDLGALCLNNLLITFHPHPIHNIDEIQRSIDELQLEDVSTSGLLIVLLLLHADKTALATRANRETVNAMDKRMDSDPEDVRLDEILAAKDAVSKVVVASLEQREIFEALPDEDTEALDFSAYRTPMNQLISVIGAINRQTDRLEKQVADLRQRHAMIQQDKTNHRLAVLTVISAVFLPLSLMAGIWGMNFKNIPIVDLSFGYPIALGLMALVGGALIWFFYKRGWFD